MRNPDALPEPVREAARIARTEDPQNPINLFNLHWKDDLGEVTALLLPSALTGVSTPIAVLCGLKFPTGSLKVGAAYGILAEKQAYDELDPKNDRLVFPSIGHFGVAGAWVSGRMGYRSVSVMPETSGAEPSLKAVLEKARALRAEANHRVLSPFSEWGNYRFHAAVIGAAAAELAQSLQKQGIGSGRVTAFVAGIGSGGTLAAGDALKAEQKTTVVGLEPKSCSFLFDAGFGAHRVEGIGPQQATWIHNAWNMDALMCIDDLECLRVLLLFQEGTEVLTGALGVPEDQASRLFGAFGVSGVCNVLGAIKTAKYFKTGPQDLIVTVAPDGAAHYASALAWIKKEEGGGKNERHLRAIESIQAIGSDGILDGAGAKQRWHNQKYFTWVEQYGKSLEALEQQKDPDFWQEQRERVTEIDKRILERRRAF